MLELLQQYWLAFVTLVLGTGGGGLIGAWVAVKKVNAEAEKNRLEHQAADKDRDSKTEADIRDDLLARVDKLEEKVERLEADLATERSKAATLEAQKILAEGKSEALEKRLERCSDEHRIEIEREKARRKFAEVTADHLASALEAVEKIDDRGERSRYVTRTFTDHLRRGRMTMKTPVKPLIESLEETTERRESEPQEDG